MVNVSGHASLRRGVLARRPSGWVLEANWKADTLGLANGASVTSWPDATSKQGAITASGSALVHNTAQQNGLPTVAVAASNGAPMTMNTSLAQPLTVLLAMKLNLASQTGTITKLGGTQNVQVFLTGTGFDMNNGTDMVRWTPDTAFHVFTLHFAGAASLLRVDGVQQGAVGNAGSNGISAGASAAALAGQSNGYSIGELAIYQGAGIPTAQEAALRTKWGTP